MRVESGNVFHMKEMRKLTITSFKIVEFAYDMIFNESIRHMQEFSLLLHTPPPETAFLQHLER